MLLFIPRSLCALKRIAAKAEHARYGGTQGIRIALASGIYRAEATDGHRAMVVQGMIPEEDPPWPGFKDLPDDACEAIILPRDLERAAKVGDDFVRSRFDQFGIATMGNDVHLGLGSELVTARTVEGRFPDIERAIPRKRPLFTFRVDPKVLAETLLAMADLLPEEARSVQCFYYGEGHPIGFCARNIHNGLMIDALVVLTGNPNAKDTPAQEPAQEAAASEEPSQEDAERSDVPVKVPKKTKCVVCGAALKRGDMAYQDPDGWCCESCGADRVKPTEPAACSGNCGTQSCGRCRCSGFNQFWQEAKARQPGMLLLCRLGDRYEAFGEDAETVAKVLGTELTTAETGATAPVPMTGFVNEEELLPKYLQQLLAAGHRVAIVDDGNVAEQPKPESVPDDAAKQEPAPDGPPVTCNGTARARRGVRRRLEAEKAEKGGTPS